MMMATVLGPLISSWKVVFVVVYLTPCSVRLERRGVKLRRQEGTYVRVGGKGFISREVIFDVKSCQLRSFLLLLF